MAHKPATYYRDDGDSDITGILIVEDGDGQVRVTENRESGWCKPFWMPHGEFTAHTHVDEVEKVGVLPDDKHEQVLSLAEA